MTKYEPALYDSPLEVPEGVSGDMRVSHQWYPPGHVFDVVSMREAFLANKRPARARVPYRWRVIRLTEEGRGVWMSDHPMELNQVMEGLHYARPTGRILCGGLGLGVHATIIARLPAVEKVVVVERSQDVIKLCANDDLFETVEEDILAYLIRSDEPYDHYILDTWQGTGESTWWEDVMPLRRAIRNRWGRRPQIHCWAEDTMVGQVVTALTRPHPHWYYEGLRPMPLAEARRFVRNVGFPTWERRYGDIVDTNILTQDKGGS